MGPTGSPYFYQQNEKIGFEFLDNIIVVYSNNDMHKRIITKALEKEQD